MNEINNNKLIDLLKEATDVFIHHDKLIIDIKLKRIIVNNIKNGSYYLNLYKNNIFEEVTMRDNIYCEKNLKLILKNYPDIDKREWLAKYLNLSRGIISDKYHTMLLSFEKNNRYSKQYWKEELEELKKNKNNLEFHANKYNRSLKKLKDVVKQYNL